jgi:polyhydroxyalkanoate synthesis regulator phasin
MAAKKTAKKESKFYIAKTINQARETLESKVKDYNERYVKKQLENGREFITELKADPVKRIDDLIDDGKDAVNRLKSDRVKTLQKKIDTTKKQVQQKMDRISEETRTIYRGIENDAKLIFEDIVALGKKNLDKIPMKKTIEKKISDGFDSIPAKLNIPSKKEIDNLVRGIDGVNKKVDALNKQSVTA